MPLALLAVAAAVFLLIVTAGRLLLRHRLRVWSALSVVLRDGAAEEAAASVAPEAATARGGGIVRLRGMLRRAAAVLSLGPLRRWAERSLRGSGLPLRPEEFLAIALGAPLALWVLGGIARLPGFAHIVLTMLGLVALPLLARRARARRDAAVSDQLGDMLTTVGNGLRAGHSLLQALEGAARSTPAPLGDELRRLQRETVAGISLTEALVRLKDRTGNQDLELFVTAVLVQHQVGGNLAEVLDKISGTIRARVQVQSHLRVVTAQSRLSGWVVSLVPVLVFAVTSLIAPQVERTLTATILGRVVAGVAILLELMGAFVISRVIAVKY